MDKLRRVVQPVGGIQKQGVYLTSSTGEDDSSNSSDEYDTDLETDFSDNAKKICVTQDYLYESMCRKLKVQPNTSLRRQLQKDKCSMRYQALTDTDSIALSIPLQNNDVIETLDLRDNLINNIGTQYISHMLTINRTITALVLSGNNVGASRCSLDCLVKGLLSNETISRLDLSSNNLSDNSAHLLSKLIQNTKVLTTLNLSHNQLSSNGGILIGASLSINESIYDLNLSWNHLRLAGANKIAFSLKDNVTLKRLILTMNGFGVSGATCLGMALKSNRTLLELDICENRISIEGAAQFGKHFTGNETLQILRMGKNPIGVQGSLALIKFLQSNLSHAVKLVDLENVMVLDQFMTVAFHIKETHPEFVVKVGTIVSTAQLKLDDGKNKEIADANPLGIVIHFMESQRMRIVDLFKTWDTDNSQSLSREEFKEGLKSINTPLTESQLDELIEMLDDNGNGEIELSELMHALNVEYKGMRRKIANAVKADGPFPKSHSKSAKEKEAPSIYDEIQGLMPKDIEKHAVAASLQIPDVYSTYRRSTKSKTSDDVSISNNTNSEFDFDF